MTSGAHTLLVSWNWRIVLCTFESLPASELDILLSQFSFYEHTKENGGEGYDPAAISRFQRTVQRYLKEQCHEDFAVLGQFCPNIITLRL